MKALLGVVLAVALSLSTDCFAESPERPEVFLQLGHSGLVHAVAVSPDGSLVASADFGGVTRLWKTSGNKEIGSFPKERMPILRLVWSPDGRMFFAGTADGRLLWLDAQRLEKSREQSCTSSGSLFELRAVAVSRDGREVACGNLDGNISVFSVADGTLLRVIDTGGDGVRAMAVTPDGGAIVAGGAAKIQRFRWRDGRLIGAFPVPDLVADIAVFKRTPRIAVSFGFLFNGKETAIRGYDLNTGNETFVLTGSRGGSQALAISADERTLYAGMFTRANPAAKSFSELFSTDFRIHEWNLEKQAIARSFEGHSANVAGIALAPSGERLYSASWDETLRAWNLRDCSQSIACRKLGHEKELPQ